MIVEVTPDTSITHGFSVEMEELFSWENKRIDDILSIRVPYRVAKAWDKIVRENL